MIEWAYVTLVVPVGAVDLAKTLAADLEPFSGVNMYLNPLSASGSKPATHYFSSGCIDANYAALLDAKDAATVYKYVKARSPGTKLTQADVQSVFNQSAIYRGTAQESLPIAGLTPIITQIDV